MILYIYRTDVTEYLRCLSLTSFTLNNCPISRDMLQSTDGFPLNFGFTGKGNSSYTGGIAADLEEQIQAGAIG